VDRILAVPVSKLGHVPTETRKATKKIVDGFVVLRREYGPARQPQAR